VPTGITKRFSSDLFVTSNDVTNANAIGLTVLIIKSNGSKLKGVNNENTIMPEIRNIRFITLNTS
jgi:hypothetical protein